MKILKLLVIVSRDESPLEEIKSMITGVKLEKVSKSRANFRSIKPSNNAIGCSSKSIGVGVRKFLNIMLNYDLNFAQIIKAMNRNKLENLISMCVQCHIQGNAELLSKFY